MSNYFKTKVFSSLAKVFPNEEPKNVEISRLQILKNEKESFQVSYFAKFEPDNFRPDLEKIEVESALSDYIKIYRVEPIHSNLPIYVYNDGDMLTTTPLAIPDLLLPLNEINRSLLDSWQTYWFELDTKGEVEAGEYEVKVKFIANDQTLLGEASLTVEIINAELPAQELIITDWFHSDCLATYYRTDVFSDEYWRIVENFIKTYVEHGMNMMLTPIFTPALDTAVGSERPTVQLVDVYMNNGEYTFGFENFEKWIKLCQKYSIKYFEMAHLFTQWGAKYCPKVMATVDGEYKKIFGWETEGASDEYVAFLAAFSKAIKAETDKLGITEQCYFHVSDEPNENCIEDYSKASKITREYFSDYKIIDALSHVEYYDKGLITLPIPITERIDDFAGKVPELWTYYCCGPHQDFSNRFMAMPSRRNRIVGIQLYKYGVEGFLHWGYNFWYSKLSVRPINPFGVSDANDAFPSGDAYTVYPDFDGNPLVSLRLKVFNYAIQDISACKLLEQYIGKDKVVELLEEDLEGELKFNTNPRSEEWQLNIRNKINALIKEYSAK